jgi:hypothetical protein
MTVDAIVTATGEIIANADIEEFRAGLLGQLLRPSDDGYDAARKIWNGVIDRPADRHFAGDQTAARAGKAMTERQE